VALYLATLTLEKGIIPCDDISVPAVDLGTRSFGFLPNDRRQRKKMLLRLALSVASRFFMTGLLITSTQ
jgi:hypothetical protein